MFAKRATLALGVLCAAGFWMGSAQAASCPVSGAMACYDVPDTGLAVPFTAVQHNTPGSFGTDEIDIVIDGPNGVASPGIADTAVLRLAPISGLSSLSYVFTSTAAGGPPNSSGPLSTTGNTAFNLILNATSPAGGAFSYYKLLLSYVTDGSTGGGYNYSLDFEPCVRCATNFVPVPPAAILFVSGLAGLGLLGRRRRKSAQ